MRWVAVALFLVYMLSSLGCSSPKKDNKITNIQNQNNNEEINVVKPGITLVKTNNIAEAQLTDFKKEYIVWHDSVDFNLDNKKEEVFFIGTYPKTEELRRNKNLFYNPSFFVYKNLLTNKFERIKVEFQSYADVDLLKEMLTTKYADIDGDKVPEVLYSYDFPMLEQIARALHILKYNLPTGSFEDYRVEGNPIATWAVEDRDKDNILELVIEYDQYAPTEKPFKRYYKLTNNGLVQLKNN